MVRMKKRKFYINANDYITLAVIVVLLCVVFQFTVRLFFIDLIVFKIANIITALLLILSVVFVVFSISAKIKVVEFESKEQALAVVQRFVRENSGKHNYDLEELIRALKYLKWLEEGGKENEKDEDSV